MDFTHGHDAGPLPELRPMLKQWIRVNAEYVRRCVGADAPWWFNERAALSTVAAATWKANGIALEEYTAPKVAPGTTPSKLNERCRCDLFISFPKNLRKNQHHDFITEAKIIWPRLDLPSKVGDRLWGGINVVRKDIRRTMNDGYSRRLGLLLISPWTKRSSLMEVRSHIKQFVETLRLIDGVAVAWLFAQDPSRLRDREAYYPGTALIVTPLRRT